MTILFLTFLTSSVPEQALRLPWTNCPLTSRPPRYVFPMGQGTYCCSGWKSISLSSRWVIDDDNPGEVWVPPKLFVLDFSWVLYGLELKPRLLPLDFVPHMRPGIRMFGGTTLLVSRKLQPRTSQVFLVDRSEEVQSFLWFSHRQLRDFSLLLFWF